MLGATYISFPNITYPNLNFLNLYDVLHVTDYLQASQGSGGGENMLDALMMRHRTLSATNEQCVENLNNMVDEVRGLKQNMTVSNSVESLECILPQIIS